MGTRRNPLLPGHYEEIQKCCKYYDLMVIILHSFTYYVQNPDTEKPITKKRGPSGKKTHSKAKTSKLAIDEAIDSEEPECDGKDWEVQKIVDVHYNRNGSREFLVRWAGYKQTDDTWEPEEHLECPDLIAKYMSKVEESKNATPKELRTLPKHTDRFTLMDAAKGRRLSRRHDGHQRCVLLISF